MRARLTCGMVCAAGLVSCRAGTATDPRMIAEWTHALYGTIRVERLSPPVASRLTAYATTALYAGLAAADSTMPSVAAVLAGAPTTRREARRGDIDPTITAVTAEGTVLDSLLREALPTTTAALRRLADSLVRDRQSAGVSDAQRARSGETGRAIGLAVVAWSRSDGFDATRGKPYVPPKGPGLWFNDSPATTYSTQSASGASETVTFDNPANQLRAGSSSDRALILSRPKNAGARTLPAANMAGATEPYWGTLRPFVLDRWNDCVIPRVNSWSTAKESPLYRDALEVHRVKENLTADQRTIALFWADNAGESGTPAGHWLSIASQIGSERHLSAKDAARALMLTAAAQADAFIAAWGYKYQYNLLRPRTYIRRVIDPGWEPTIPTPPFPEYPAGHSTQSAAAATVLTSVLGDGPFTDSTGISIGHAVRRFESFHAAALEAGESRIYGGIHFPSGNSGGRTLGECIGDKVVARWRAASK